MRKLMIIGLAIVSLTFAGNVQAQNKRWSLQECIDHAIRHNIEVKQSRNRIEKLKVEKSTLKNSFLPASSVPELLRSSTSDARSTAATHTKTAIHKVPPSP